MADLTITAANVEGSGGRNHGTAAATITAGQAVRKDSAGQLVLASDDSAANAQVAGIALANAAANQPLDYQTSGNIDLGATIEVGKVYVLSTSGGIAPIDDVAGGEFVTVIGVGLAADSLKLGILPSGVAAAGAVA